MIRGRSQITSGIILSYIAQAVQIVITLLYTPIMLRLLEKSEYGLYHLAYSVISYLSLFTFGFSSSYVKFYSTCLVGSEPQKEISKLNGMFLSIFTALGLLTLSIGSFLAINTETVLGGKLTESELQTAKVLMWIMVVNSALHFPLIVFNNHIIAREKFVWLQVLNLLGIVLNPLMTFPLLLLGFKSISLALTLLIITIIKLVLSIVLCISKLKMRFIFKEMQFKLLKDVGAFSFFIFIETIISMINISLDRFLLGKMVGLISVAIYTVGGQINTLYTSLSTSISSVFTPRINRMVAEKRRVSELSDLFIQIGKLQYSILLLILIGFIVFGERFIQLWAGKGYEKAYIVALVLILPNTINLIQNIAIEVQRAMGLQKYRSYIYSVIAIMNIIISILLIGKYHEVGAAMGTGIAWIIGSGIIMNIYYSKRIHLDIWHFWKEIGRMSLGGIPIIVFGFTLRRVIMQVSLVQYFVLIATMIPLYLASMYFLGLKGNERRKLFSYVKLLNNNSKTPWT